MTAKLQLTILRHNSYVVTKLSLFEAICYVTEVCLEPSLKHCQ